MLRDFSAHPLAVVRWLRDQHSQPMLLEFSYYKYVPRIVADERHIFSMPANDLDEVTLSQLLISGPAGYELALHSRVRVANAEWHIPMVDLSTAAGALLGRLRSVLPSDVFGEMVWFESGRSFHGYGLGLVSAENWRQLLGRLLLANVPSQSPIVDPRWIGHRLIAGYSALRWSRNTSHYIRYPHLVSKSTRGLLGASQNRGLLSSREG
jgi:hypothetical protein